MAPDLKNSQASLEAANRDVVEPSQNGGLGAKGYTTPDDQDQNGSFLSHPGEVAVVDPPDDGLKNFKIGVAWDNVAVEGDDGVSKFFKKTVLRYGVDLDLGCLYKLKDGHRGAMQALGDLHGSLKESPFIALSEDERSGDKPGQDEMIWVSGVHWDKIEKILIYVYIYDGARDWAEIKPQVQVRVPGQPPMAVTLHAHRQQLPVCAVASLESVRGGIKMTNHLEYFAGHPEMDRAFGFGLQWESGSKD